MLLHGIQIKAEQGAGRQPERVAVALDELGRVEQPCAALLCAEDPDGRVRLLTVDGDMPSIMAGLCCGEPNILGWDILRNHTTAFVSCPDWVTARGMRTLGAPEKGDPRVISGESGAVTTGLVETLMLDPEYAELKELIGLDKTSSVLCFSTEGDTDRENYRSIVWDGLFPSF